MANEPPKAKDIFLQAVEISSEEERAAFLDDACARDAALRRRVEALIVAHERPESLLDNGAVAARAPIDLQISEKPGTVIGPYKLLQKIGEGGFGAVYLAEQLEPVERQVALKIIKPGMDTRQVIARFEAERQALAMMDHPNIARVLDAGATDSGRPYFVMELVNGVTITEYCDEHRVTPHERLELFVPVCEAVQHAHQKGIIHRDIKPSNVLVTEYDGRAVPKIIDFGVAKAIEKRLTERTAFTQLGQVVGTLDYMSPEQADLNQVDIDTRSDIYSLGVLLYELLTGETPFDGERLRAAAFDELLRIIREEEPPKPSLRLSSSESLPSTAANRKIEPKKLNTLVRGELDWIVMKALEKDRSRRYETANGFAFDIQRYLSDEPVVACPPSAAYRFRKFARRNKAVLSVIALLSASLLLGIVGTTWQAIRATRALGRAVTAERQAETEAASAKTEAAIARAVNEFMNEDLLGSADPYYEPNRDLTIREVLDRASQRIEGRFVDQPLVKAQVLYSLGSSYRGLGVYGKAQKHFEQSRDLYQQERGTDHIWTLRARNGAASAINKQGRHQEAEKLHREVLAIKKRVLGPDDPAVLTTMMNLANAINKQGRCEEAEKLYREALQIQRRVLGNEHAQTVTMMNLANAICRRGCYEEAEKLYREALQIQRRVLGEEHPDTVKTMVSLAAPIIQQERYEEAEDLARQATEISRRVLGPEHPSTLQAMMKFSIPVAKQGRSEEAEKLRRSVLEIRQRTLGEEHIDTLIAMMNLGVTIGRQGRFDEAEELYREALEIGRRALGPEHPIKLAIAHNLAGSYTTRCWQLAASGEISRRDPVKAVEFANLAIELEPGHANHWSNLGVAQFRSGNWQGAVEALEKADGMLNGGDHFHRMFLAMAQWQLGDEKKARQLYAQGAAWLAGNREDSEQQIRFRNEAEQLMLITEEERKRMVEEYLSRQVDEPAKSADESPIDRRAGSGNPMSNEVEAEEPETEP